MSRLARMLLPIAPVLLVACGGDEPPAEPVDENVLYAETGEFEAPPGDSFECFYTNTVTDRELAVYDAFGYQDSGGHHLTAYWTDIVREPQHHPCQDDEMVAWHQIAGASPTRPDEPGVLSLPEGMANRVPAGKQLVLQAHYINTTGAPQKVNDWIKLRLIEPEKVESYVNYFVPLDDKFEIAAHATSTSTTICTLERDFQIILGLPHMHEWGKDFKLERLDDQGNVAEVLLDTVWSPEYSSHPPVTRYTKEQPLVLTKGTRLRQTCTWDNTTADPLIFPREMCLSFFLYFPDDEGNLTCNTQPEEVSP
ncbi:hypothetical protein [Polyangium aurulentum]|uniref:monooxygenase n=1 Tax=Polyangium aurulentum TaxID=2567896 RepID=UPI00146CDC04|nr:hypothetical protein [Polyangium aurulentum]UQA60164.1 hypothetical protein E8A73_006690 [Polyangium aurulentum]